MRYFFYGTLMDRGLLSAVIGRKVPATTIRQGMIRGYRLVALRGTDYPIVLVDRMSSVRGHIVSRLTAADQVKLALYEGQGYKRRRVKARYVKGRSCIVSLFVPVSDSRQITGRPWSFAAWVRVHKKKYLAELAQQR